MLFWCLTKQRLNFCILNRQGSWQRQNTITQIFLAAASKGLCTSDVAHVIAAVIQNAEEMAELAKFLCTGSEAGTNLKHGTRIFASNLAPVLNAKRLLSQPPLHTFCYPKAGQQFRE